MSKTQPIYKTVLDLPAEEVRAIRDGFDSTGVTVDYGKKRLELLHRGPGE